MTNKEIAEFILATGNQKPKADNDSTDPTDILVLMSSVNGISCIMNFNSSSLMRDILTTFYNEFVMDDR